MNMANRGSEVEQSGEK